MDGIDSVEASLSSVQDSVENAGEGLLEAAADTVFSSVVEASTIVWQVRSGLYSSSWVMEQTGPSTITIANDVDYSAPLEYGWTSTRGAVVESPGVLIPSVIEGLDDLAGAFAQWLNSRVT